MYLLGQKWIIKKRTFPQHLFLTTQMKPSVVAAESHLKY